MAAAARSLVQYVVLRGDLSREPFSWPLGASVAQACHAALAVVHAYYEHPDTAAYLVQDGSMRTVVLEVSMPNGVSQPWQVEEFNSQNFPDQPCKTGGISGIVFRGCINL